MKHFQILLLIPLLSLGCGRAAPVAKVGAAMPGSYYGAEKLELRTNADGRHVLVVTNVQPAASSQMSSLCASGSRPWTDYLLVTMKGNSLPKEGDAPTPIAGTYALSGTELTFTPKYPISKGATVEAFYATGGNLRELTPFQLTKNPWMMYQLLTETFIIPKPAPLEETRVLAVYPSADTLPENQLKFYIHFSAPMSRGFAYSSVYLFDDKGKDMDVPFLELGEELWNPTGTRFTLFFDPGRIKRELAPRQELGPALVEGKTYTLVVEAKWRDAEGHPLKQSLRKTFKVGPPDDQMPDLKTWKLTAPKAGTKQPVVVVFPEPLDHGLLERVLTISDPQGKPLAGKVQVADQERRWQFTPEQPWAGGTYELHVEAILEDLAGNNLARPFEVDLLKPIQREEKSDVLKLPFDVK
jgi:hypothetical protein